MPGGSIENRPAACGKPADMQKLKLEIFEDRREQNCEKKSGGAEGRSPHGFTQHTGALAEYVERRSERVIRQHNGSLMACCICPGHDDRTPSMHVTGDKWFCHGCNHGGNLINLIRLCEGLNMGDACELIAREWGESALPENVQMQRAAFRASQAQFKRKTTTR